tara:strand:+ start:84 stop:410 length:327 start_codon:yes stop_codon:yes gene_type:complete
MTNFSLSKEAADRIKFLLKKETAISYFRISVLGGGCSGFQYEFSFSEVKNKDDILYKEHGINYLIDESSINFLSGSKLEYIDDLGGAYFSINNPNATANCGCGTSFSI